MKSESIKLIRWINSQPEFYDAARNVERLVLKHGNVSDLEIQNEINLAHTNMTERLFKKTCSNCNNQYGWPFYGSRWNHNVLEIHFGVCPDCNDDGSKPKPTIDIVKDGMLVQSIDNAFEKMFSVLIKIISRKENAMAKATKKKAPVAKKVVKKAVKSKKKAK